MTVWLQTMCIMGRSNVTCIFQIYDNMDKASICYCMGTLTRRSWIHYKVCWIGKNIKIRMLCYKNRVCNTCPLYTHVTRMFECIGLCNLFKSVWSMFSCNTSVYVTTRPKQVTSLTSLVYSSLKNNCALRKKVWLTEETAKPKYCGFYN